MRLIRTAGGIKLRKTIRKSLTKTISSGEMKVRTWLVSNQKVFEEQKEIPGMVNPITNKNLKIDFLVTTEIGYIAIEFDGSQHTSPFSDYHPDMKSFRKQRIRDKAKNSFCKENSIKMLRISYKQKDRINRILSDYFNNISNGNKSKIKKSCNVLQSREGESEQIQDPVE